MSQPPAYNRSFSFTNFQATNPTLPPPGSAIDGELNNVKATLDATRTNLAQIQRDDGALKNGSVTFDTLSPALQTAGLAPALPWVTSTTYAVNASVTHGSAFYRCLVAHTSGVFATDLAAGKWVLIVDFSTIALVAASLIAVTPSGTLTSDVQTSLQALDTGKAATSHTHLSSAISDSTAAGRALLTAADATAQNNLLGTTSLGFQSGDVKETAALSLPIGWYYCDGSNKNRVTDVNLFNAITIRQNGTLTNASPVVTGLSDTTNGSGSPISPGMPVSGTGIPAGTVVQSVDNSTQVTLSQNATTTASTALVFAPYGVGDGSTTFGLPNRAYVAVGRDNAGGSASNVLQVSTNIALTSGSTAATVGSATGLFVGMYVSHPNVPNGTKINVISGTTLTLSAAASGTASSTGRFSPILDAQTPGATGGELSHVTTTPEMPSHTHGVSDPGHVHNVQIPTGLSSTPGNLELAASANTTSLSFNTASATTGISLNSTGGSLAHNNQPKSIVMNFIIKR
ncbi:hypothetical protein [Bradyrhizobium iriomotense]|uniref:Phage tail collar domain-containing protein n=1 Tax=Bradyrhizobium iriomotense TaxID=441950 RepID=A0ABQ6BAA4_9BRAD|nr:hypothetical protein [Bradyrhizobium iriomotense]GLR91295.1 hypothetical protein GCM10007857_80120 [Bradyrhizobium iriomotense]